MAKCLGGWGGGVRGRWRVKAPGYCLSLGLIDTGQRITNRLVEHL